MTTYATYSDEQLLLLLRDDNHAAFTELYHRYWEHLYALGVFKLGDSAEAEELAQDLFLDLWNRRQTLEVQSSLLPYWHVALNYRVLNMLARRHRRTKAYAVLATTSGDNKIEWGQERVEFREMEARIEQLMGKMPRKCRQVFRLSRDEQYSYKQIARELNIAEHTVESHIARALRFLRTGLGLLAVWSVFR